MRMVSEWCFKVNQCVWNIKKALNFNRTFNLKGRSHWHILATVNSKWTQTANVMFVWAVRTFQWTLFYYSAMSFSGESEARYPWNYLTHCSYSQLSIRWHLSSFTAAFTSSQSLQFTAALQIQNQNIQK